MCPRLSTAVLSCIFLTFNLLDAAGTDSSALSWRYSLSAALSYSSHSPAFGTFVDEGIELPAEAGIFDSGDDTGLGLFFDGAAQLHDRLWLGLALDFRNADGDISTTEEKTYIIQGVPTSGVNNHTVSFTIRSLGLTPSLSYDLPGSLYLRAGLRLAFVIDAPFTQRETIQSPEGLEFPNGSSRRVLSEASAGFDDVQIPGVAALLGLGVHLPLNEAGSLGLRGEMHYQTDLTSITHDVEWKAATLALALGITITPTTSIPVLRDTIIMRDTIIDRRADIETEITRLEERNSSTERKTSAEHIRETLRITERYRRSEPKKPPLLLPSLKLRFALPDGSEAEAVALQIRRRREKFRAPLLPYIFFAEGSDSLPQRYRSQGTASPDEFTESDLDRVSLPGMYRELLNIVGSRLRQRPGATLVITGCNDGGLSEAGDSALSQRRAAAVRDFLRDHWQINPERMPLRSRLLPERASSLRHASGRAENRRAELSSDDSAILAPVRLQLTSFEANPPELLLYPEVLTTSLLSHWSIAVTAGDASTRLIQRWEGVGSLPPLLRWSIAEDSSAMRLVQGEERMQSFLTVQDTAGFIAISDTGSIRFRHSQRDVAADVELRERYSLLFFGFDDADLRTDQQDYLQSIRPALLQADSIVISGTTDNSGSVSYNRALALQRAENVADLLGLPSSIPVSIKAANGSLSNELPEGRCYNRSVSILVDRGD